MELIPPRALLVCGLSVAFAATPAPHAPQSVREATGAEAVLLHPTMPLWLPAHPEGFWFAPRGDGDRDGLAPSGPQARLFRAGVDAFARGEVERAAAIWAAVDLRDTPLADYLTYYQGLAALQRQRWTDARRLFAALKAREPLGYLAEAAVLGEARAAEGQQRYDIAVALYQRLGDRTTRPDLVWLRLGRAALAAGDRGAAARAFARVVTEFPLSDLAAEARGELARVAEALGPPRLRVQLELARADRLFDAQRYSEARGVYEALRPLVRGAERRRVDLRMVACDLALRRAARARDRLRPYLGDARRDPEVRYLQLSVARRLGRLSEFVGGVERLVDEAPESLWTERALDDLATHYAATGEDAAAARVFGALYARFPTGPRAERAAWKAGWWAYRTGDVATTARLFDRAAATFPRSDYRPAYLYWAGRAYDRLGDAAAARARYELAVLDYGQSYYGRLAARALAERGVSPPVASPVVAAAWRADEGAGSEHGDPPTKDLIRLLLALDLYDDALNELLYAERVWGSSPAIEATRAWVYWRTGEFRRGILAMKRAYPAYLSAAGAWLPEEVLRVLFPLAYWEEIQRAARARDLDPFLLAALVAQESSFDPAIRSSANAYGLMQLLPTTARRVARALGLPRFRLSMLTDPEANLRLGTAYLARLLERFGALHLALAAYNAGEQRVVRWLKSRADLTVEEFIEDIPFAETQNYVKKILGTVDDYRRLYGATAAATQ